MYRVILPQKCGSFATAQSRAPLRWTSRSSAFFFTPPEFSMALMNEKEKNSCVGSKRPMPRCHSRINPRTERCVLRSGSIGLLVQPFCMHSRRLRLCLGNLPRLLRRRGCCLYFCHLLLQPRLLCPRCLHRRLGRHPDGQRRGSADAAGHARDYVPLSRIIISRFLASSTARH